MTTRVAYLVSQYPAVSHVFIEREVLGLRARGVEVHTFSVRKPDPKIYLMMCEALDVAPDACVYLDDLGINCKPAAALGMTAIKVNGEHQARDDLGRVLGMNFD